MCRLVADALDEFDACREYVAVRGCELTEIPSTKSYVDRVAVLRIPDPDARALTASPIDLLADYYLPLFIAEFRDRKDEFIVKILMNEGPCSCDTFDECGCDYSMSDIMCLPWEGLPGGGGSTISGRIVKTIRDALLADVDESVRRMVACGYDMTVGNAGTGLFPADPSFCPTGKTCYIRRRLNPGEFCRPLFGEGRAGSVRFPAQFTLTFQTNAIPQGDGGGRSTDGWRRITLTPAVSPPRSDDA